MAKKLSVTIELEMTVPDEWQIIETEDGIGVLKIGRYGHFKFDGDAEFFCHDDAPW